MTKFRSIYITGSVEQSRLFVGVIQGYQNKQNDLDAWQSITVLLWKGESSYIISQHAEHEETIDFLLVIIKLFSYASLSVNTNSASSVYKQPASI